MPSDSHLPPGLVLPVRCGPGGPTRKQARGSRWRRTSHGYYVPADVARDDVRQRIVEASVVVPPGGAITGWAALAWRRGRWFDGRTSTGGLRPVSIVIGTHDVRNQPGIRVCGESTDPRRIEWVDGLPVAVALAATSFEMRYAPTDRAAIVALDMAAYSDLVSLAEMHDFLETQYAWNGIPRARRALARGDENVWSPAEVDLVETWCEVAGRPRPVCNRPIFDRVTGAHIGTPDVFDPSAGVAGEYDGDLHLVRRQRDHDLRREGDFRRYDIEIATMTAPDRHDPRAFVDRLATAYTHAARHSVASRRWTLDPPRWWTPSHTVDLRRAMDPWERRRFLAHRAA